MRRLLGAMRQGDDLVELTPGPGLDDLPTLAGDVRAAGLDVRLHVTGEPVALSRSVDLSAYRIVQEGLTNALKHSGGRRADVTVAYGPDQLRLEVRDDGPGGFAQTDGFGHGLIGIGERVKAYGGDMSAFVATSGGFVLRASLPLEEHRRMTIRVLVVDDQAMVRAGFRMLLGDEPDIEVVAEASNGLEAVAEAARVHPHVVLMDIRMPELDGLEATRRIVAADQDSRILILTTFDLDEYVYGALRAGSERLRPQGRPTRAADRRHPHRGRWRRPALAGHHPARDPALHPAAAAGATEGGRDADRARDGRVPPDHARLRPTPRSVASCSSATPRSRPT